MSTYTFHLPNFASEADLAERALLGMDAVHGVSVDQSTESITVDSSLTYGETLDVIREQGISAS
ncbi:hypothetical protein [Nocardia sp. IFM 10818]